ncbi:MAG: hypothetical protein V1487_01440 [bacterium]
MSVNSGLDIHNIGSTFWFVLPYQRNQDVVSVKGKILGAKQTIAVVDGWHNEKYLYGNAEGKAVAELVADYFPKALLSVGLAEWEKTAQSVADQTQRVVLNKYPKHVSCVASFLFRNKNYSVLCSIGTIHVYVKRKNRWVKPQGIHNNWLDWRTHESGSSTFLGRGELASSKQYSHRMDYITVSNSESVLVMTDGVDNLINQKRVNALLKDIKRPEEVILALFQEIVRMKKHKQRDDISVLVSGGI